MRRLLLFVFAMACMLSTGFAQLFPAVDNPTSGEASMLALQFSHDDDGSLQKITNLNFTGWAPAVTGPNGEEVPFRVFGAGADFTTLYYSENLTAGEYTLTGFFHVYTDYDKLDEYKAKTGDNKLVEYEPYAKRPYHVRQLVPLRNPVVVKLEPNTIMSFGSFAVRYSHFQGLAGEAPDRWRANDDVAITVEEPYSDVVLRYMKPWRSPKWKKWNAKNPAQPL